MKAYKILKIYSNGTRGSLSTRISSSGFRHPIHLYDVKEHQLCEHGLFFCYDTFEHAMNHVTRLDIEDGFFEVWEIEAELVKGPRTILNLCHVQNKDILKDFWEDPELVLKYLVLDKDLTIQETSKSFQTLHFPSVTKDTVFCEEFDFVHQMM